MQPKPYKDNNIQSMTESIPQRQNLMVMRKQDLSAKKMNIISNVIILLSILIAVLTMGKFERFLEQFGFAKHQSTITGGFGIASWYVLLFVLMFVGSKKALKTFVKMYFVIRLTLKK